MWSLETTIAINQTAARLAAEDQRERDALVECGIDVPTPEDKDKAVRRVFDERVRRAKSA